MPIPDSETNPLREASLDGKGRLTYPVSRTGGRVKTITAGLIEAGFLGLDYLAVPRRLAGVHLGTRVKVAGSPPRPGSLWDL